VIVLQKFINGVDLLRLTSLQLLISTYCRCLSPFLSLLSTLAGKSQAPADIPPSPAIPHSERLMSEMIGDSVQAFHLHHLIRLHDNVSRMVLDELFKKATARIQDYLFGDPLQDLVLGDNWFGRRSSSSRWLY